MKTVLEILDRGIAHPVPLLWSDSMKRTLRETAENSRPALHALEPSLARAILDYAEGEPARSETAILRLLRENIKLCETDVELFNGFLKALVTIQRFDIIRALLHDKYGFTKAFEIGVVQNSHSRHSLRWVISPSDGQHRFLFDASIYHDDHTFGKILAFHWIFPLLARYSREAPQAAGSVFINLGDIGEMPGLAFCDSRPDRFLIPDAVFLPTGAYHHAKLELGCSRIPWINRRPAALWRGSTTGIQRRLGDWRALARTQLCEIGRANSDIIDAGITSIVQFDDPTIVQQIQDSGLMRNYIPSNKWPEYKYQIDIDGNTNAWSALFYRLLTGSPVLKVESSQGFIQWYYDRLKPWHNYVPVAPDMSDLVDKIKWLARNDAIAQHIGQNGQRLAESLTYEEETKRAVEVITAAFAYFNGGSARVGPFGRTG